MASEHRLRRPVAPVHLRMSPEGSHGEAGPCFPPPTLPPQSEREGRMRINGRLVVSSRLLVYGFHCDAEATSLTTSLHV